jgi:hypothetical protein
MTSAATMRRFCFAHDCAFVVPAEALGKHGVDKTWADAAVELARLTPAQLGCLDSGFALYWRRATELFKQAPGSWFPPRQTNVLVVSDPTSVAPYFDPFGGTSSLLYLSDLDTNAEYLAFLLLHNERVSLLKSLRAALICNLSYWLVRDAASVQAFSQAARQATRPGAQVFVHLADNFEWLAALRHPTLHPLASEANEPYLHVEAAELLVPKRLQPQLSALLDAADAALRVATQTAQPARRAVSSRTLDGLCDWMHSERAHLIVKATDGRDLWSPGAGDTRDLRHALGAASDEAVASLHRDFALVHERSRAFLKALVKPADLPRHCPVLETGDGAYLDAARHAVVYELVQPGFDAGTDPAPPYHRLLLGARVVHEWGHLAHTAKLLRVPEENKVRYRQARAELGEVFLQVLSRLPKRLHADVADELHALAPVPGERAAALARKTLSRVGDYLANLLCSRLLPAAEMQAYVRHNVHSHLAENLGLVSELARYAYEVHYLGLAQMPRSYFFGSTGYTDYFVHTGLVSEDDTHALFDAVGRVLACYAIDESRLLLPQPATAEPVH